MPRRLIRRSEIESSNDRFVSAGCVCLRFDLRICSRFFAILLFLTCFLWTGPAAAVSYVDAERLLKAGRYDECLEMSLHEFERGVWNDRWPQLAVESLLLTGQYENALAVAERALKRFSSSLGVRLLAIQAYRYNDQHEKANAEIKNIYDMVRRSPWRFSASRDRIALGRFFLQQGEDAREVLELFYDRVRKSTPQYAEAYIASAELAIEKHDYALASSSLDTAAKLSPSDPRIEYLRAVAFQSSDVEKSNAALQRALQLNPLHLDSLFLQIDHLISGENYDDAKELLTKVLSVNRFHPKAWAYHAVIAHLQNHFEAEFKLREIALENWSTNPNVDHWIGTKLSQKYLFAEGSKYQQRALIFDPKHKPARFQLAQDLLRLGKTEEGWKLAHEVHDDDAYNVVAFNLVTLHDQLQKFATITDGHFVIRMDAREAKIYGEQVLSLLQEARSVLAEKYQVAIDGQIVVEVFPRQRDFAIRTFGLPGGEGFLGVCFGRLITANSPASQGDHPSNWRSVLWHEYCHVLTLEKTKNRMPRWLSEGISVYEERQRNDTWGERMTPQYHQMILGKDFTPVRKLSSAFLRPKSPVHLQFAYYESSLVVEYFIDKYGLDVLIRLLDDIAVGMTANEAIQRYAGSLDLFENEFFSFAKQKAENLAPKLEFDDPEKMESIADAQSVLQDAANNYWALQFMADAFMRNQEWSEAAKILKDLHQKFPNDRSSGNAERKLALIHKKLGDENAELQMLKKAVAKSDDDLDSFARLMELCDHRNAWQDVHELAKRYLAVQPLQTIGHEMFAKSSRNLLDSLSEAQGRRALLEMDPIDPAEAHFQLAQVYHNLGATDWAKRQVLMALEFAPRYREAQKLLLELVEPRPQGKQNIVDSSFEAKIAPSKTEEIGLQQEPQALAERESKDTIKE